MDGRPAATLFINSDRSSSFGWGIGLEGAMRLFMLDLGGGRTLLIDIEVRIRRLGGRSSQMRCRSSKASSSSTDIARGASEIERSSTAVCGTPPVPRPAAAVT
jgi:hypothetical protein